MERRPWPVVILAFLHIVAPITNIAFSSMAQGLSVERYLRNFFAAGDFLELFLLLGALPVAGVSIYLCKRWSYPVFLIIQSLIIYSNLDNWVAYPEYFPISVLLGFQVVNIGVTSYFLVPAVRSMYFNPRLRWWESLPRYLVSLRGTIQDDIGKSNCRIIDLSMGGAFFRSSRHYKLGDKIFLSFNFYNLRVSTRARVAFMRKSDGLGYGVQFIQMTRTQKRNMARLVRVLSLLEVHRTREVRSWRQDFLDWSFEFLKTGKGLLPEKPFRPTAPVDTRPLELIRQWANEAETLTYAIEEDDDDKKKAA